MRACVGEGVVGLGWWAWDVNVPLTSWGTRTGTPGPGATAPPPPPPPGGEAAGRLLLLLAELLSSGLATAWRNDQQPLLHAMLLPPEPTLAQPSDVKVGGHHPVLPSASLARGTYAGPA